MSILRLHVPPRNSETETIEPPERHPVWDDLLARRSSTTVLRSLRGTPARTRNDFTVGRFIEARA